MVIVRWAVMMRVVISLLLLAVMLPVSMLGCGNGGAGVNGEITMSEREMPVIDTAAPAATATATFALG
jgi:hypothetical protein